MNATASRRTGSENPENVTSFIYCAFVLPELTAHSAIKVLPRAKRDVDSSLSVQFHKELNLILF